MYCLLHNRSSVQTIAPRMAKAHARYPACWGTYV